MSNLFSKHLHLCFFKLKYPTTPLSPPHPKQQQHPHHNPSPPSTSTTFLFNTVHEANSSTSKSTDWFSSSSDSWDTLPPPQPPDLAAIFASQRFFFSSPGRSNSIIESPDTRPHNSNLLMPRNGAVRVPKYSLNPYLDFRRSMQEMAESRDLMDVRKDWDYLHELLLSYLSLNPPHTHKYIIRAFTDLVVDLLSSPPVVESSRCRKL